MHGKGNIFKCGHIGQEAEVLKNDADGTAQFGNAKASHTGQIELVDHNLSAAGLLLTQEELGHRGFSRSAGTHDENKFAILNLKIDVFQGAGSVGVDLGYVVKAYHSKSSVESNFKIRICRAWRKGTS